jgi:hypothetical protein
MIIYILLVLSKKARRGVGRGDVEGLLNQGGMKKGKRLTLRGSPSPDPESWSRREPPLSLGSTKSAPSMREASGAGCLCTRGSSAAWRPNSDAKGKYIGGNSNGQGTGKGIKGSDGSKVCEIKLMLKHALYFPHVHSSFKSAWGHGLGGEAV